MNKKHLPLIVAIALPIVFVIVLALVVLVPNMAIKPEHDFIYTDASTDPYTYDFSYGNVRYQNSYDLQDEKIVFKPVPKPVTNDPFPPPADIVYEKAPRIYYYDVQENTSREISFEDAQKLALQKGPSSPDGYTVSYDMNHEGVFELFGSEDTTTYVIGKGHGKKPLTGIVTQERYYRSDLNIIGWIK